MFLVHVFVYFVRVIFYLFRISLGVISWLRVLIVAVP